MHRPLLTIASISFAVSSLAGTTLAQSSWQEIPYLVRHSFDFRPAGDVVDVRGADFRHVWVRRTGAPSAWAVQNLVQDPNFDPFGTEGWGLGAGGAMVPFNSGINAVPVECVFNVFTIPPTGINSIVCLYVDAPPTSATACTGFFVAPFSAGPPFRIQGSIESSGLARAALNMRGGAEAYAFSSAAVFVRGGILLANGSIQWSPTLHSDIVGAGAGASALRDPIHFTATNTITGQVIQSSLLDFEIQSDAEGTIDWSGGIFQTDLPELDFVIDIPPLHVAPGQSGRIELRISGGAVQVANDSGRFNGMLPAVGTAVPLVFPLPGDFDLDYDLALDPAFPWNVDVDLSGGGGAHPGVSGCPADVNGDGVLNFFDVLAYLENFSSGHPSADLNGDDELNFFDVLLFLEVFSSNCA